MRGRESGRRERGRNILVVALALGISEQTHVVQCAPPARSCGVSPGILATEAVLRQVIVATLYRNAHDVSNIGSNGSLLSAGIAVNRVSVPEPVKQPPQRGRREQIAPRPPIAFQQCPRFQPCPHAA